MLESGSFTTNRSLKLQNSDDYYSPHKHQWMLYSQSIHQGIGKSIFVFCKGSHTSTCCEIVIRTSQKCSEEGENEGENCFNCLGHYRVSQCTFVTRSDKTNLITIKMLS